LKNQKFVRDDAMITSFVKNRYFFALTKTILIIKCGAYEKFRHIRANISGRQYPALQTGTKVDLVEPFIELL
jgi:hypothetical protein